MWKVSCFYGKVHNLANLGGYAVKRPEGKCVYTGRVLVAVV